MKSLIWPLAEAVIGVLTGAIGILVIARIIGAEAFGLGSIALGIIVIAQVGVNSLLHDALVRSERLSSEDVDVAFTASVFASLIIGLSAGLVAPPIGRWLNHEGLTALVCAFVPMLMLSAMSVTMIAERRRALDFNTVAVHQIVGRVVGATLGIAAALSGAGIWSLVVQYTCTSAYTSAALYVLAPRWPRVRVSWMRLAPILRFGSPIIASQLVIYATNWLFLFTMGRTYGLSAAGHWGVATRIADGLFGGLTQAVYQVALARLAQHQGEPTKLRAPLLRGDALSSLAIPFLVGIAASAEPLLIMFLGAEWAPTGQLVLGPLVGSFILTRQILLSAGLRVIGISAVSLLAALANAIVAAGGLLTCAHYSPLAISAIYALSVLPGYVLIYVVAARVFNLPLERGAFALTRDLALSAVAVALGRSLSEMLPDPYLLMKILVAGGTASLVAGLATAVTSPDILRTMLNLHHERRTPDMRVREAIDDVS